MPPLLLSKHALPQQSDQMRFSAMGLGSWLWTKGGSCHKYSIAFDDSFLLKSPV